MPPSGRRGGAISAAHHTLPLPSYAEVTDLKTGRTILVRVERRGPGDSQHAIELSPGAAAQLGIAAGSNEGVRVRRVNPPEQDRALLRSGNPAPERMATPKPCSMSSSASLIRRWPKRRSMPRIAIRSRPSPPAW
jgi:rare lipoprotein A